MPTTAERGKSLFASVSAFPRRDIWNLETAVAVPASQEAFAAPAAVQAEFVKACVDRIAQVGPDSADVRLAVHEEIREGPLKRDIGFVAQGRLAFVPPIFVDQPDGRLLLREGEHAA